MISRIVWWNIYYENNEKNNCAENIFWLLLMQYLIY